MSTALFTNAYFYPLDKKQWRFKQPYPPLMTIQAAAVARQIGFDVHLADSNLVADPHYIRNEIQRSSPKYFVIVDDGFNYLTKMCLSVMREAAFSMIKIARESGCIVVVNSSDSSDHAEKYLATGAHYVIRGEVEETLRELLPGIDKGETTSGIPGITFLSEGNAIANPTRPIMRDLDSLPMPAWDLIKTESYRSIWKKHHGYFSLNMATTRGCPYKCNWCAKPIYGNRYNSRTPEHVVTEIEYLLTHFKPDHLWMCDDIFGLKPGWVQQFNSLLSARQLFIKYKIQSRVDLLLEADTIKNLKESGAETVWVGAESGSQKILDSMDKGTTTQQIRNATALLKKNGIRVGHFIQFGYLHEQQEDIQSTIDLILELMPNEIGISVSYPLPGTKFYDRVKSDLKEKQNWVDSDDLHLMFKNQYSSKFYKVLHRYVHNRYRIQRGINQFGSSFSMSRGWMRNVLSMIYNLPQSWMNAILLNRLSKI